MYYLWYTSYFCIRLHETYVETVAKLQTTVSFYIICSRSAWLKQVWLGSTLTKSQFSMSCICRICSRSAVKASFIALTYSQILKFITFTLYCFAAVSRRSFSLVRASGAAYHLLGWCFSLGWISLAFKMCLPWAATTFCCTKAGQEVHEKKLDCIWKNQLQSSSFDV